MRGVIFLFWCISAAAQVPVRIGVNERDGFVDADRDSEASMQVLRSQAQKLKSVRLVDDRKNAKMLILVAGRHVERIDTGYAEQNIGGTTQISKTARRVFHVRAIVKVDNYSKEFLGRAESGIIKGPNWNDAAADLLKSVEVWIQANRERLKP